MSSTVEASTCFRSMSTFPSATEAVTHCDNALLTIIEHGPRVSIGFDGIRLLQIGVEASA